MSFRSCVSTSSSLDGAGLEGIWELVVDTIQLQFLLPA